MNEPNLLMREIRAHERLIEAEGATRDDALRRMAHLKLLALKTQGQALSPGAERENARYIADFNVSYAAWLANKGAVT